MIAVILIFAKIPYNKGRGFSRVLNLFSQKNIGIKKLIYDE